MVDLDAYDLVVTSCFGFAKGVKRGKNAVHVCYCHTPMRWVWRAEDYFAQETVGPVKTVIEGVNGIFFREPTVASLKRAMERFAGMVWDSPAIQAHARRYDTAEFQRRVRRYLAEVTVGRLPALEEVDESGGAEGRRSAQIGAAKRTAG